MALPRSLTSQISAIVPAPTACTEAAAPPPRTRMIISMPMDVEIAEMIFHRVNSANETRYIVLRPSVSEKEDHQRGNIDMASIYIATERFVMVGVVFKSVANCGSAAIKIVSTHLTVLISEKGPHTKEYGTPHWSCSSCKSNNEGDEPFRTILIFIRPLNLGYYTCKSP